MSDGTGEYRLSTSHRYFFSGTPTPTVHRLTITGRVLVCPRPSVRVPGPHRGSVFVSDIGTALLPPLSVRTRLWVSPGPVG